jgi:hypothetical protein
VLTGTATVEELATAAPTLTAFATEPLACPGADLVQVVHEVWVGDGGREAMVPPALHPVNPPCLSWSFLRAPESVVGPFTLAVTRLLCRSGVRARGFLVGAFVDNAAAGQLLASQWGLHFPAPVADVRLVRRYDRVDGLVAVDGRTVLDLSLLGPQPLSASDVQFTDTMTLAHTPLGLRLVQVEQSYAMNRAERARAVVHAFDGEAWGRPALRPSYPVSATAAAADVTFEPVRFVCQTDQPAFTGTERV